MNLPTEPDRWTVEIANAQREEALAAFGFTQRQARFLVHVLVHSGVFVERQYCRFAGIVHGQKSTDFIRFLVERRYATPITTGRLHRGRMFHVHYKPLWAAIGEPDSRFRKPAAPGRLIERVMILDAVLECRDFVWLGTAIDKRRHFMRYLGDRLPRTDYPHLAFGDAEAKVVRYFPDKLPIGVELNSHPHVLLYLVTNPSPMHFRLFLLRHMALLTVLHRWTIRLLVPRQLKRAQLLYLRAAREHLAEPLHPSAVDEMEWYFRERQHRAAGDQPATDQRFERAASAFRAPRFRALYRHWLAQGANALWVARSTQAADASNEITGASSASNSHGSTCISLPLSTSPDPEQLRTTSGTTCEIEVVPVGAPSAEIAIRRRCSAGSQHGEGQVVGGEDVGQRRARTVGVGRRPLPPHAVAVTAGTMA